MRRLSLVVLVVGACACPSDPATVSAEDARYYASVCERAGMRYIPGSRSCIGADSSFINLEPRH